MKIMAKQATNWVSIIKLHDRQCTQTGRETLKELFRVHFCESVLLMIQMMSGGSITWTHAEAE
jgi:hypothetical protein